LSLPLILESWVLNLESWSWFLELESWNLILDSWNQTSIWTLKCSWFNLELILWFLRSSSLLSWSVLDFWGFLSSSLLSSKLFESILIHHEACFYRLHHGHRRGLHGLLFFSHPFILLGCANASWMHFWFFYCLLPTLTRPQCLCPHCHYLSLPYGSVGAPPLPFTIGPFVSGVRSPFHIRFLLFLFLFAPLRHRPSGSLMPMDLVLVVPQAARHPSWWFSFWSRCFLREATRVLLYSSLFYILVNNSLFYCISLLSLSFILQCDFLFLSLPS